MLNRSSASLTAFNAATSIAGYAVSLAVAIAFTPFLVRELGLTAFGMIALSFALVQYAGPVSQTISATISVRLMEAREDQKKLTEVFSTAVSLCLGVATLLSLVALIVAVLIEYLIQVPPELVSQTRILFLATASAFLVALVVTPLSGIIFSHNAIFVLNVKQSLEAVVRVTAMVLLFVMFAAKLEFVALAICASMLAGLLLLVWAVRFLQPGLRYSPGHTSAAMALGMARTGGGVALVQIGTLFILNSDLLLVNLIYGPEISGAYSAAAQWAIVLRGLVMSVAVTVNARVMLDYYAGEGADRVEALAKAVRLLTCFAALPAGFVAGAAPDILRVWIGPEVAGQAMTLVVLALSAAVFAAGIPIVTAALAADRIGQIGRWYFGVGIAFPLAAAMAAKTLGWSGLDIALTQGIFLCCQTFFIFIPLLARSMQHNARRLLTLASLRSVWWTLTSASLTWMIAGWWKPAGFGALLVIGMAVTVLYAGIALATLPDRDRRVVLEVFYGCFRRNSARV